MVPPKENSIDTLSSRGGNELGPMCEYQASWNASEIFRPSADISKISEQMNSILPTAVCDFNHLCLSKRKDHVSFRFSGALSGASAENFPARSVTEALF